MASPDVPTGCTRSSSSVCRTAKSVSSSYASGRTAMVPPARSPSVSTLLATGKSCADSPYRHVNAKNRQVIEEFRANGGVVSVRPPNGPILLLHTVGAKSGRHLVTPLIYRADGDDYVVLASMGGWKTNPAWYHNLVANPETFVEVGREQFAVTALIA